MAAAAMESPPHRTDGYEEPTIKGPEPGLEVHTGNGPEVLPWELGYSPAALPGQSPTHQPQYSIPRQQGTSLRREPRWRSCFMPVIFACIITTLISAGAIGGGLGSSLASCGDNLRYAMVKSSQYGMKRGLIKGMVVRRGWQQQTL